MRFLFRFFLLSGFLFCQAFSQSNQQNESFENPPIYIAFLWHMHQPIYWPYETVTQTDQNGRYSYSVTDIHNQRLGPYNAWPKDAVQKGINAGMPHFGAQVSFSGSLIENLNNLESAGNGNFQNWKSHWNAAKSQNTSLGNPRLDMVGFGYHHPLMGLIEYQDIRKQIQAHKQIMSANFSGSYSKGIFPPENAFSPREIPALVDEGIEWAIVDNIHFDRACQGYPFNTSGNLYEPNKADQLNNNPNDWVQLNGLWAPTLNSARWGRQPHYVEYIDPSSGTKKKIIAIPADRYMGNEDGRGGFGALNYENVMSQMESYNTDPNHPILIVLHHDGDNYGGGTDSYYGSNFQNFVNWLQSNPTRFVCTTVQDYLELFPPDSNDVIHIEDGSWSGADNGDPEFKKWNGDPSAGYSPDRNSWGIITAAKNFVATADQINPSSTNTQNAWKYFLNGEASDYWYWDGSQNGIWDSHPARASNLAIPYAQAVIACGTDLTPPTIYVPQREPYNPGGTEWGINQPNDFTVWTYAFDVSGLKSVTLRYRTDLDGVNSSSTVDNETYSGGSDVSTWTNIAMTGTSILSQTNPAPLFKAKEYAAQITGQNNVLIDYYVEAVDSNNNIARSPIMHVWVGANTGGGGGGGTVGVSWLPLAPTDDDTITVTVSGATQGAKLHWGVNFVGSSWQTPNAVYRPAGSTLFNGAGPAVETPMLGPDTASKLTLKLGPFNNAGQVINSLAFVIHYNNDTWDNNSNQDFHITISGAAQPQTFMMDGSLDTSADLVSTNAGLNLYVGWNGTQLYIATQSAQSQNGDMFIFVADSQRVLKNAQWAKSGQVAGWSYFLGNESSNNWNGWFNASETQVTGYTVSAAGSILEGAINLQSAFGAVPSKLYLTVGKYGSADGGLLTIQVPAENGNGNIESAEWFLYEFDSTTVITPPNPPALLSPPDMSTDHPASVTLRWATSEAATHYYLQVGTDSTFTNGNYLTINGMSDTIASLTGLASGTTHYWHVRASNAAGVGNWSGVWRFTTALSLPAAVTLLSPVHDATIAADSVQLRWRMSTPAVEKYWLEWSTDSLFTITTIDSLLIDTSTIIRSLGEGQSYWWRARARNGTGWSSFSEPRKFMISYITTLVGVDVSKGWNMVSMPVVSSADSVTELFPLASFPHAFSYGPGSGYQQQATMTPGTGYWIKLLDGGSFDFDGTLRYLDTIDVSQGWNMIGTLSFPLTVESVVTEPNGIITSPFYGFDNGYISTGILIPGKAYWVKVSGSGKIILSSPPVIPK